MLNTICDGKLKDCGNILAFDHGRQFPAITGQHAFEKLRAAGTVPAGLVYVAYPWATLIDKLQWGAKDAKGWLAALRAFCAAVPKDAAKVTVCQHIGMRKYLHLFPLYPVQVVEETGEDQAAGRPPMYTSTSTPRRTGSAPGPGGQTTEGGATKPTWKR